MISIIQRINVLLKSNLNCLLEQAEDPELMLDQAIRDMDDSMREARDYVVKAIAAEKQLKQQLNEHREQAARWESRAEVALKAGDERLARDALGRKVEHQRLADELEPSWEAARRTAQTLKGQLEALRSKRCSAAHRRSVLVARQRAARAQRRLTGTISAFRDGVDAECRFERMAERVAAVEAEADAFAEVMDEDSRIEREVADAEQRYAVDLELAVLRERLSQE